ncbi:hypothetical protein GCM10009716_10490 [Streptomyces sodiiphilus]|uniref:B12-binding N-terminal domain-containing protein n=1 Tax=Streptomyces sodiiphilus TaxID=226217 RepID=A0ABN2NUM3_9ACTN
MTATAPPDGQDVRAWASKLWDVVGTGDEPAAVNCAAAALEAGVTAESVLLDMVGAVQRRVGEEWAANRLTVAREHAATAVSNRVVTALPGLLPAWPAGRPAHRPGGRPSTNRWWERSSCRWP